MIVKWVIESKPFGGDADAILSSVKKNGMEVIEVDFLDYIAGKYNSEYLPSGDECVITYGSLSLVRRVRQDRPNWIPGAWYTSDNFRCNNYYPYFAEYLLNKDYIILPLGELVRRGTLLKEFGSKAFVRPVTGWKTFTGSVVDLKDVSLATFGYEHWDKGKTELVVIASEKSICNEWRFVVCNKRVIAGSKYITNEEIEYKKVYNGRVWDYAQSVISDIEWEPDPIYTIDICESVHGKLFVLELNAFSTSGLYDCDPDVVVETASDLAAEQKTYYSKYNKLLP